MKRFKIVGCALACCLSASAALANAADWHWDQYGTSGYTGQIVLRDDQGSNVSYQRYGSGSSPSLFGSVSSQSPLMVVAGSNVKFDIVMGGTPVPKPICNAPETAQIFVSPVTVCNISQGTAIGGINTWADQTATTFIPRIAGWFQGYGWRTLNGTACGRVEVKTVCQ